MTPRSTLTTLTGGALAGLVGVLVLPRLAGPETDQLATIATHDAPFLAGKVLTFVGAALLMLGFAQIARRLTERGHRVASAFSITAAVGYFLHTSLIAVDAVVLELAMSPDRAAMADLLQRLYAGPVFVGILVPMLLTTLVGTVGAVVALWRLRDVPAWAPVTVVVALVSDFVTPEAISGVPMFALLAIAFGALALRRPAHRDERLVRSSAAPANVGGRAGR